MPNDDYTAVSKIDLVPNGTVADCSNLTATTPDNSSDLAFNVSLVNPSEETINFDHVEVTYGPVVGNFEKDIISQNIDGNFSIPSGEALPLTFCLPREELNREAYRDGMCIRLELFSEGKMVYRITSHLNVPDELSEQALNFKVR